MQASSEGMASKICSVLVRLEQIKMSSKGGRQGKQARMRAGKYAGKEANRTGKVGGARSEHSTSKHCPSANCKKMVTLASNTLSPCCCCHQFHQNCSSQYSNSYYDMGPRAIRSKRELALRSGERFYCIIHVQPYNIILLQMICSFTKCIYCNHTAFCHNYVRSR
jgi:hypothetical protein